MKTTIIRALTLMLALIPHLYATAFESDGLYYNILSEEDRTVEVTYKAYGEGYVSGDIEIPRRVRNNSKIYTVISIGADAFENCRDLTSVTIPNSVISIAFHAFNKCSQLRNINIAPENVEFSSIDGVVYNKDASTLMLCPNGKTAVTIPNSVSSIGISAFENCSGLTSLTIPNSVNYIGECAFYKCSKLETIYVQRQVPLECDPRFPDDVLNNATLYVPTGTLAAYEKVDPWRNFWNIEEMNFSGVEETATDGREPQILVENGIIRIGNAEGNPLVEVFDISGKNVFRGNDTTVSGLAKGIYIVKVGANMVKVQL